MRHADGRYAFDGWNSLWSLLARITLNKCASTAQRMEAARRDVRREFGNVYDTSLAIPADQMVAPPTGEQVAILHETLAGLMEGLKPRQRQIISLKLQQFTNEEISHEVGCTERTVYRLLKNVRHDLSNLNATSR